ncbi:MAG: hypothetical protein JWO53_59, partial [Chlamydiia bacterium]|nr:hypothetical protein [Chlamydiia bacterium]
MRRLTPQNATPFLASKWLHIQFLIDKEEMEALLKELSHDGLYLFSTMGIKPVGESAMSQEAFLLAYGRYVAHLQAGRSPDDEEFRPFFTAVMTSSLGALQALDVAEGKEIIRPREPIVQLQLHRFDHSSFDGKIRPMVLGKNTISWGLQISYPQLFQDPATRIVQQASSYANFALFKKVQAWIRTYTLPTPCI